MAVNALAERTQELERIASEISEEHEATTRAINQSLYHARRCGQLLLEAKAHCEHGEWQAWLEQNFQASYRTAAAYMRIATRWEEVQIKSAMAAHLSLADALRLLAEPREEAPSPNGNAPQVGPAPVTAPRPVAVASADGEPPAGRVVAAAAVAGAGVGALEAEQAPDIAAELEAAISENEALQRRLDSLNADDKEREIQRLHDQLDQLTGNHEAALAENQRLKRRDDFAVALLRELRELLGVERNKELIPAIRALQLDAAGQPA